jgi:hypothetical protein
MKKPKFIWEFSLVEENSALQIDLNGGMCKLIRLAHPLASHLIAEQLAEVLRYEHDVATKTEAYNIQAIYHALTIAKRQLEGRKDWQGVLDEANREYKKAHQSGQTGEN